MPNRKEKMAEFAQSHGYNVIVTGRHVHVTDGMKQHAIDRISRLDHIGQRIVDVHVTMDIQKLSHTADILMKYGHTIIRSHASTTDMYVSIDQAVDKLSRQLRKYKKRLQEHHAKDVLAIEMPVDVYASGEDEDFSEEAPAHRIVATETKNLRLLTEAEAIMKMELSGDPLLIYRSDANKKIKVIYRREDGNYGVIQPEG
jgi:putative sigma-54 modulation protein